VDIKTWDIQNLLIVYQTFELSLKIKIVSILKINSLNVRDARSVVLLYKIIVNEKNVKELNFNLVFLTICHNFYNLVCKKPNLPNVYF
jgi:hypothetical protein